MSVPMDTPSTKNWTLTMVPSLSVAVAVTVLTEPTPTEKAAAGAVTLTDGATLAATVIVCAPLVDWMPTESVAMVLSEYEPGAVGAHEAL